MSAILSADDLNDFISPGVACIKPIEPLPQKPNNPYEVTTEDKLAEQFPTPAQISLTDCLACSGCVTSAEAVLVSLQSHGEVLSALDRWESRSHDGQQGGKVFVATVSLQVKASIAATFSVSLRQAENMIVQLLAGSGGLASGGKNGSSFRYVFNTDTFRQLALVAAAEEVSALLQDPSRTVAGDGSGMTDSPAKPILTSACPGWICYAEKTHPHILPHLSRLKSPQALAGTMIKSVLAAQYGVLPEDIWHLAIMPCFDKKLEASRSELTSSSWTTNSEEPIRDVDCVITARELISLASARNIPFSSLSTSPILFSFPDPTLDSFLFPKSRRKETAPQAGTSDGYLYHILRRLQAQSPNSTISTLRGRNADVIEYTLLSATSEPLVKFARYYGFRNIQNLVRKLKPAKTSRLLGATAAARSSKKSDLVEYAYVEVMACPGGCTNGGGQIRAGELDSLRSGDGLPDELKRVGPSETKAWLGEVDEAYFSSEDLESSEPSEKEIENEDVVDGISRSYILDIINYWSTITGISSEILLCTSYRKVESDVGKSKKKVSDVERVAGLASSLGGGW